MSDADAEPPSLRPHDPAPLPALPRPADIEALRLDEVSRLLDIAYNPAALAVVVFALDAGLYEACRAPIHEADLAARLSDRASDVAVEMTVELSSGLGLVERQGEVLTLTDTARKLLLEGSPVRLTGLLRRHQHYLRAGLGSLTSAIAEARRSTPRMWTAAASREEQDEHFALRQSFSQASIVYFADTALLLFLAHRGLELGHHRLVCDLGAGPGALAGLLKRCHPAMRVRAVDVTLRYPRYRDLAAGWLAREGCDVELLGLNILHDPVPSGHDLVLVNRVITGVPKDAAAPWLRRIFETVAPGGRVAFGDYFFTGDPAHDLRVTTLYAYWATSDWLAHRELALEGPVSERDPRVVWGWLPRWTTAELAASLRDAGFVDVTSRPALSPLSIVEATRP